MSVSSNEKIADILDMRADRLKAILEIYGLADTLNSTEFGVAVAILTAGRSLSDLSLELGSVVVK